jgi:hypothetical protein
VLTPKIGLSSSSIPKELLPQLETEEDLEQILADAGEGDTTDGTTNDDESAISTDISEADTDSNIASAEALQSTSSLVTTEIAPIVRKHQLFKYSILPILIMMFIWLNQSQKRLFNMHENEPYQDSKFRPGN